MNITKDKKFLNKDDVMQILDVGRNKAYEVIRILNKELNDIGKLTKKGLVPKEYFFGRYNI